MTVSTESSSDANRNCTHGCFLDKIIGIDVLFESGIRFGRSQERWRRLALERDMAANKCVVVEELKAVEGLKEREMVLRLYGDRILMAIQEYL